VRPNDRLSPGLDRLNALPADEAEEVFLACCGARRWAREMAASRPFADVEALMDAADRLWLALGREDWLEAFSAHPRIGESGGAWSRQEQAGAAGAAPEVKTGLVHANRLYEERFGHVFLVCATGKSAEEMLALCNGRMANVAETELAVAAGEQAKITRLRLEKWMAS
jgi:OHCU decarboxylase